MPPVFFGQSPHHIHTVVHARDINFVVIEHVPNIVMLHLILLQFEMYVNEYMDSSSYNIHIYIYINNRI